MGTQLKAFCSEGYELTSINDTITCLPTQKWDVHPSSVVCRPVDCAQLNITNGYIEGASMRYMSSIRIVCDQGYRINNNSNSIVTCQASGTWDADVLTCQPITCGDPPQLINGHVTAEEQTYNTTAIYECNSGYRLVGVNSSYCSDVGDWVNPYMPTCVKVYCQHPGKINHGQIYGRDAPVGATNQTGLLKAIHMELFSHVCMYILGTRSWREDSCSLSHRLRTEWCDS